jgi:hypothetical protein
VLFHSLRIILGKKEKTVKLSAAKLLREKRYIIEQFNGHVKENILARCWVRPKGLVKKAALVVAGLISYDAEAIRSLITGEKSLKSVSKYWA